MTSLSEGRSEETARRRERVLKAVAAAVGASEEVSVSAIARAARVDRSFFYRHRDLLERIHAAAASPSAASEAVAVTRASLQADLANALERNSRLTLRVRQLEQPALRVSGRTGLARLGPQRLCRHRPAATTDHRASPASSRSAGSAGREDGRPAGGPGGQSGAHPGTEPDPTLIIGQASPTPCQSNTPDSAHVPHLFPSSRVMGSD